MVEEKGGICMVCAGSLHCRSQEKNMTNSLNWLEKTVLIIINAGMTNTVDQKATV